MKKELKDFIHLYLGCEIMEIKTGDVITFDELHSSNHWPVWTRNIKYCSERGAVANGFKFKEIKPLLRPLSSMTEEEYDDMESMQNGQLLTVKKSEFEFDIRIDTVTTVHYLLSKHFDIFNLISEGLAIDKTKL